MKKIFSISGSTRSGSTNVKLLKHIADLTGSIYNITLFEGLADIPHFNPDLDTDDAPALVKAFRQVG